MALHEHYKKHTVVTVWPLRRRCARDLVQSPFKTVIRVGTTGLAEPLSVSQTVQAQLLGGFSCRHRIRQFLLNGKETLRRASCPRSIAAINDADQTVCSRRNTSRSSCSFGASLSDASPFGRVGPPSASRRNGPSVPWVSLPGHTGVMIHPG